MNPIREGSLDEARQGIRRVVLRLFLCLLPLPLAVSAQTDRAIPYIPRDASVVLQHVPPTTDPRVRAFDFLRADFDRHPRDSIKAVALAKAYVNYGRSTGDARFLGRAMAVIDPFMKQPAPPIPVLLMHATIQQSRHFFEASRQELAHILKLDPDSGQAWLTLATVAMVQGDVDLANKACVQLANNAGNFMGMVCSASLRSLTGHGKQAYVMLSMVEDPGPKAPPAIKAWIEGLMADIAVRLGEPAVAETHFKKALQETPDDNFLLADYGDFLLGQKRPQAVVDLIGNNTSSDTSFLRLVLAESMLGSPRAAADAEEMSQRFLAMDRRGSHVYRREQAGFVLQIGHDPQRALALATQNWTVQRAPKDVLVYLQAALAAHDPAAARPVLDFLARTHLDDVRIQPLVAQLNAATADVGTGATAPASESAR